MIDVIKIQDDQWKVYQAFEDGVQISVMKWKRVQDNAEIHFQVNRFQKAHLKQYKEYFETIVKQDMRDAGCQRIVAVMYYDLYDYKKVGHFWKLMGFDYFCAVMEV